MIIVRQPFKLPIGLLFDHLATGGVIEPLQCDACKVVMPYNKHSVALTFETRYSIGKTCTVVWSCGYCATVIQVAHWFDFWPFGHMGVLWSNYSVMLVK